MSRPTGIDHIDIVVDDIEAMCGFFEAVGFTVLRRTGHGGGAIELRFPGAGEQPILELTSRTTQEGSVRPLGLRHMALRVENLEASIADFSSRGLAIAGPPRKIPDTGRRIANLRDPAGNVLQLVEA